jgi:hypothetical protein
MEIIEEEEEKAKVQRKRCPTRIIYSSSTKAFEKRQFLR